MVAARHGKINKSTECKEVGRCYLAQERLGRGGAPCAATPSQAHHRWMASGPWRPETDLGGPLKTNREPDASASAQTSFGSAQSLRGGQLLSEISTSIAKLMRRGRFRQGQQTAFEVHTLVAGDLTRALQLA
jgi:hypothetical protein